MAGVMRHIYESEGGRGIKSNNIMEYFYIWCKLIREYEQ